MNCPAELRLLAYLDREVPDAEARGIESHMANCPRCTSAYARLTASLGTIDNLIANLSEMPLSAAPAPAVHPEPLFLKRMAAGAAIAACTLLATLLSFAPAPAIPKIERFVALDEMRAEPIQFGAVVRVSVPASLLDPGAPDTSQKVQAEVLLGDDGRPRAIRLLN
jgi:anti-sigma factor RsiW